MMNKSKMEFCDFTFNPVTGCRTGCAYCYAAKQARRFSGDVRLNKGSNQLQKDENGLYTLDKPFKNQSGKVIPYPVGFEPTLHRYRLAMPAQKKKPANIFVCSLGDLFGPWIPDSWIQEVFKSCDAAPWHNYLFMTKYPQRLELMSSTLQLPRSRNFWYGTTVTRNADLDRIVYLPRNQHNQFISIEPILEAIDISDIGFLDWIIIGAETSNRRGKVKPNREWIEAIVQTARAADIPLFMKHSKELEEVWGNELIQELPAGLIRPEDKPIPHCRECDYHKATERHYDSVKGTMMMNHICEHNKALQRVPGRYARTSPPWCPLRSE
jgi:protein gp37